MKSPSSAASGGSSRSRRDRKGASPHFSSQRRHKDGLVLGKKGALRGKLYREIMKKFSTMDMDSPKGPLSKRVAAKEVAVSAFDEK